MFVLTAILFSMPSSTCLAATKEATNIFPRTLLTLNLEKWNDGVKLKGSNKTYTSILKIYP